MDNLLQEFQDIMSTCDNEYSCARRLQVFRNNLKSIYGPGESPEKRIMLENAINIFKRRLNKLRRPGAGDGRGKHRSRKHRSRKHRRPRQRKTTNKR